MKIFRTAMKKLIQPLTKEELSDYPITDFVKGWYFKVVETSNGAYIIEGKDPYGHVVSRQGSDPDELLNICKNDIQELLS
jgi:hypothetical protein